MEESVQRKFMIGDEWLYFKIYSGPKTLESILVNEIYLLVAELKQEHIISKFFFIRYSDPDYHLRIRFHLSGMANLAEAIYKFNQMVKPYIENRLVWNVCADTYNREFERYGKLTISEMETLFCIDSLAILNYLKETENSEDDSLRWLWGVKCVDTLLGLFGLTLQDKSRFCETNSSSFSTEYNMNKPMKIQLDKKFRREMERLEKTLNPVSEDYNIPAVKHIEWYSQQAGPVIQSVLNGLKSNNLEIPLLNLLSSLVHMHFNRLFRTKQRMHEFVIYYCLNKFYKSQMARLKYNPNKNKNYYVQNSN